MAEEVVSTTVQAGVGAYMVAKPTMVCTQNHFIDQLIRANLCSHSKRHSNKLLPPTTMIPGACFEAF